MYFLQTTEDVNGIILLTIDEIFAEDSANWSVRASNKAGYAESHAKLTVLEATPAPKPSAPVFISALQDGNIKEGDSFEFRCRVSGYPPPQISWFRNGLCVDQSTSYTTQNFDGGDCVLKISRAAIEDSNEFCCRASNQSGNSQSSARLHVATLVPTELPTFVEPLENLEVTIGQQIRFECRVHGIPAPAISWSHNNRILYPSQDCEICYQNDIATLVLREASPKLAGQYICKAKNVAGTYLCLY